MLNILNYDVVIPNLVNGVRSWDDYLTGVRVLSHDYERGFISWDTFEDAARAMYTRATGKIAK